MILEGIVTTVNADQTTNISPMGPIVDVGMTRLVLRPYRTSTTYENLRRVGEGVLHVTDDVWLLAQAAVGQPRPVPPMVEARAVRGKILTDACRWYAFRVLTLNDAEPRTHIECEVVDRGRQRDFFGFNRAKHAVVEAAILATRVEFLPADEIADQMERLGTIVEKTAGDPERRAFSFLDQHIRDRTA